MSTKRPSDADNDSPDDKKLKMEEEEEFPFIKRIAILQSYGKTICQVPADELQKILRASETGVGHEYMRIYIRVHDFQFEELLVKFLAHWIYFRDSEEAVNASMNPRTQVARGVLDEEWLAFLIKALNTFDDPTAFTCAVTDSLLDQFLKFLRHGGHTHIDQVYKTCKESCKTNVLAKIFANVFVHEKKQFAQQTPTCEYDRAVQRHMYAWLADVLVADGDWEKLPRRLDKKVHPSGACFHHTHGKYMECYDDQKLAVLP